MVYVGKTYDQLDLQYSGVVDTVHSVQSTTYDQLDLQYSGAVDTVYSQQPMIS